MEGNQARGASGLESQSEDAQRGKRSRKALGRAQRAEMQLGYDSKKPNPAAPELALHFRAWREHPLRRGAVIKFPRGIKRVARDPELPVQMTPGEGREARADGAPAQEQRQGCTYRV